MERTQKSLQRFLEETTSSFCHDSDTKFVCKAHVRKNCYRVTITSGDGTVVVLTHNKIQIKRPPNEFSDNKSFSNYVSFLEDVGGVLDELRLQIPGPYDKDMFVY